MLLISYWSAYANYYENFPQAAKATLDKLEGMGLQVWVMMDVPTHQIDLARARAADEMWGRAPGDYIATRESYAERSAPGERFFLSRLPAERVLRPETLFFANGPTAITEHDSKLLYRDAQHLTPHGARFLDPLFRQFLRGLVTPAT